MSVPPPRRMVIDAPAKLNLGLEILAPRPDGFHDLATIFLAITLHDRLTLTMNDCDEKPPFPGSTGRVPSGQRGRGVRDGASNQLTYSNATHRLPSDEDNLILRAIAALSQETNYPFNTNIHLQKSIPIAAGLGGASSDVAATLLAANALWQKAVTPERLASLALELGSDIPFFLHGGCALGTGRGETLAPLPTPQDIWFVIVAPNVMIPRKTATLYAHLQREDFSAGQAVAAQAARLRTGQPLDTSLLDNAFTRALYALRPDLATLPAIMTRSGAPVAAVSGAGPAHYTVVPDPDQAERIAANLHESLRSEARIFIVTPDPHLPQPSAE